MPHSPRHPLRVLVVDDHEESARALARLLEADGHAVETAGGFVDALVRAAAMPAIDVLISDITMPDGNGCELLRLLRGKVGGGPGLSVALTGHDETEWVEECRRAGYDRFLVKPVLFPELLAAIGGTLPARDPEGVPTQPEA